MTLSWTYPPTSPGRWFNTTDASQDGAVVVGGTFQFDTTAHFGFYVLNQAGTVLQSDVWDSAYEGVFWVKLNAGGTIAIGGSHLYGFGARGNWGNAIWLATPGPSRFSAVKVVIEE